MYLNALESASLSTYTILYTGIMHTSLVIEIYLQNIIIQNILF